MYLMYYGYPPSDCIRMKYGEYQVVKYPPEKKHLLEYQPFRSVIYKNNKMVCFSPPKSISLEAFKSEFSIENVVAELFVDGTMVNVFYDEEDRWKISTKSVMDAKCTFESQTTFAELFEECLLKEQLSFEQLDPTCCYSFVMQHPKNQIVMPVEEPKLVLVSVYQIMLDGSVCEREIPFLKPYQFVFDSYEEAQNIIQLNLCKGCMLKCNGVRAKIRNEEYNRLAQIKGNVPFSYKYLNIRNKAEATTHFIHFPKDKEQALQIENSITERTDRLFEDYKNCFIHKYIAHRDIPTKAFLYDLHWIYLNELRPLGMKKKRVVDYVNSLPPARLALLLQL